MIRLVPGMPLQTSLRAVVLWRSAAVPHVALRRLSDRTVVASTLTRPALSAQMAAALKRRDVHVAWLSATDLDANTLYQWECAAMEPVAARTLPTTAPSEGLSVLIASCFYGYFSGNAATLVAAARSVIARERPAFRLLVGDNLYLDVAPDQRRFDDAWEETVERYIHYFLNKSCGDWFSALGSATTWDDHEYWNDFPEPQIHLSRTHSKASPSGSGSQYKTYSEAADEAIRVFQQPLNPPGVVPGSRSYCFDVKPLSFFVADTRTRRTRIDAAVPRLMPEEDLRALEAWAATLDEMRYGVFVMGQPLWMPAEYREALGRMVGDHNPPAFRVQYQRIVNALASAGTDLLVISGDVHFSRLASFAVAKGRRVYELITSPCCGIPSRGSLVSHMLFGSEISSQSVEAVEVPKQLPVYSPTPPDWYFGTSTSNSFAMLTLKPTAGTVAVTTRFVDASDSAGRSARADDPPSSAAVHRVFKPSRCEGDGRPLFTLRSR